MNFQNLKEGQEFDSSLKLWAFENSGFRPLDELLFEK
jgi:hypothetical protein